MAGFISIPRRFWLRDRDIPPSSPPPPSFPRIWKYARHRYQPNQGSGGFNKAKKSKKKKLFTEGNRVFRSAMYFIEMLLSEEFFFSMLH